MIITRCLTISTQFLKREKTTTLQAGAMTSSKGHRRAKSTQGGSASESEDKVNNKPFAVSQASSSTFVPSHSRNLSSTVKIAMD